MTSGERSHSRPALDDFQRTVRNDSGEETVTVHGRARRSAGGYCSDYKVRKMLAAESIERGSA
jgi:hypothetical protein